MKKIRYYITGHGLGHASRSCQILQTLRRRHPSVEVEVVTDAHDWFLAQHLPQGIPIQRRGLDFGVLQADSLVMREEQTLRGCRELLENRKTVVQEEIDSLLREKIGVVVCDIPFLPFVAAARAGIFSVGISNFTWDWIYEGLAERHPGYGDVVDEVRSCYLQGDLLLRLPFYGETPEFHRTQDLPLVARRSRRSRQEVREDLGLSQEVRVGLLSFGGFGLSGFDLSPLSRLSEWIFFGDPELEGACDNMRTLPPGSFHYPDLIQAADAVITKPGYGIVSECVAHGTAVLYTPRGAFREQAVLVDALHRLTRALQIDNERLRRGEWKDALEALLGQPVPQERIAINGDIVAADRLAQLAGVSS